ncbi:MAG: PQQ-binding-like beta-propeller repeat protein [Vicinamibacteria bacterium]
MAVSPTGGKNGKQSVDFLDTETGACIRSVSRELGGANLVVVGDHVVSGFVNELECWEAATGGRLWHLDFGRDHRAWLLDQPFYADSDVVVFGMEGGGVRCIRTATAEPVWETSVAEFRIGEHPGTVGGQMERFSSVLVIPMFDHTVGISVDTGKRLWALDRAPLPGRPRCGDRFFLSWKSDWGGWINPQSGCFHPSSRLETPTGFERSPLVGSWLVSSTHFFKAQWGWIDAWDRETGKLVWSGEAKGGKGHVSHSPMTVADGRLYYRDSTYHTYCFEEVEPSDPALKAERASGRSSPSPEALASGAMMVTPPSISEVSKKAAKARADSTSKAKAGRAIARGAEPGESIASKRSRSKKS